MNKSIFNIIGGCLLLFNSCDSTPSTLSDISNPTPADSLMFYYGEIQADKFWRKSYTDTTIDSEEERRLYLRGVEQGLKAIKGTPTYDNGYLLGVKLALEIKDLEDSYEIKLDRKLLLAGLKKALISDTSANMARAHSNCYRIIDDFNRIKNSHDNELAEKSLSSFARENGMSNISPTLFGKNITVPEGAKLTVGDRVNIEVTAVTVNGKLAGGHFPASTMIKNDNNADILDTALLSMHDGQTRQFLTTPMALFGRRYVRMGLSPQEPVIFTIRATKATPVEQ